MIIVNKFVAIDTRNKFTAFTNTVAALKFDRINTNILDFRSLNLAGNLYSCVCETSSYILVVVACL